MRRSDFSDRISVVVQGPVVERTEDVLKGFREALPNAELIVSTWTADDKCAPIADKWVTSTPPASLPVYHRGRELRRDNINRQIVSTHAGLEGATRQLCLKWRADYEFDPNLLRETVRRYVETAARRPAHRNAAIMVSTIQTANPFAKPGLVFHVSDWFYLAPTATLRRVLMTSPIEPTDRNTVIPDREGLRERGGFAFARMTAEQIMLGPGIERWLGRGLETFRDTAAIGAFLAALAADFWLISPSAVGLKTHKYDQFIYLRQKAIRTWAGTRLTTIGAVEHRVLRSGRVGFAVIKYWLRGKACIWNAWRSVSDTIRRIE